MELQPSDSLKGVNEMNWIRLNLPGDPDPWYVNLDMISDFYYNSETNKTTICFVGEDSERHFDGDISRLLWNEITRACFD